MTIKDQAMPKFCKTTAQAEQQTAQLDVYLFDCSTGRVSRPVLSVLHCLHSQQIISWAVMPGGSNEH